MRCRIIAKRDFKAWIGQLIKDGCTIGVKEKEAEKFHFAELESPDELRLDYDVTITPPKKYIQPPKETLLQYKITSAPPFPPEVDPPSAEIKGGSVEVDAVVDAEPIIIIGVHPYDMRAINQMDKVFSQDNKDTNYLVRRAKVSIIGCDPVKAGKWSFWSAMGTSIVDDGFDLWLTDLGNRYFIRIGTKKGEQLLKKAKTVNADDEDIAHKKDVQEKLASLCGNNRGIKTKTKDLPLLFKVNYEHKIWEKQAEKCYSCGSCNLVCPTCYCFDVREEMELDLMNGRRIRMWDGCLLEAFAKVGSGENFREDRSARFRHRFLRKFIYMPEKTGELACVGCGRCSNVCLPDITDPVKVINELNT